MPAVPWWLASILSNVAIIFVEYVNRTVIGGWSSALPKTIIPIFIAQYCLFRSFNGAPHWLMAWVMFAVGNSFMRVASVNLLAGQEIANWWYTSLGISTMLLGALFVKEGMR